jgi:hypothetical protein
VCGAFDLVGALASRFTLDPGVDILVHRIGGQTLGLVTLSARLRIGL